ncbi:MAG TPA: hypothetical protein EYN66_21895 [Myxococcales bacterium]|nr:hypothetical protein [Myxococcales bacterium]
MKNTVIRIAAIMLMLGFSVSCNLEPETVDFTAQDGRDEVGASAGKSDGPFSDCELQQILSWVNDQQSTYERLVSAGIHKRAATHIAAYRAGSDEYLGTADDQLFATIQALDTVPYVGPVAFRQMAAHVAPLCQNTSWETEVIFSPQAYNESHLARVTALIDGAQHSVDVAIYSFRDNGVFEALQNATARGVSVRVLFESAHKDKNDPEGTMSAKLEDTGADVRYVNKIMHHKFAIIDGPRLSSLEALSGILITGSGNWSHSAGTRFDENTVIINGHQEALLRYQQEFNLLWNYSRDLVWNNSLEWFASATISDDMIVNDPNFDALFTSNNFEIKHSATYGPTFTIVNGMNTVSDRLVELIWSANHSIKVASGHLRSRPVSQAILERRQADPMLEIVVYLDGQEYISESGHNKQTQKVEQCIQDAGDSESKQQSCMNKGFLFSYLLQEAGVDLRYKYYSYRWHYSYAEQMHNKYMILDDTTVVSGSYNLSDNAEHNTMENIAIYRFNGFPELVSSFVQNLNSIWVTGETEGLYAALMDNIQNGTSNTFPIVFDPMALNWDEVTALKAAIRAYCPDINSEDYRKNPQDHRVCERN